MQSAVTANHKLHYGKTALIGFGFMAVQIAWIIYNARVPLILRENSTISNLAWAGTAVGIIMVIDNIFGVVFQPLFGRLSDKTHTRFGKRTPYMMVGIPLCALLFILIPRLQTVGALMLDIIVFNFIMSTWRSPVVALMPDLVPSELRGEGNAVINIMGGIGVVLGTVSGTIIELLTGNKDELYVRNQVFVFGAIVMVICLLVVVFLVREPDNRITKEESLMRKAEYEANKRKKEGKTSLKGLRLTRGEIKSLIFMLIALFFNSNATDSIQTYFTTFATAELGFTENNASLIITLFAAATVLGAIPAGKCGQKWGRKKTIILGWIVILAMFLAFYITKWVPLMYVAILAGGFFISSTPCRWYLKSAVRSAWVPLPVITTPLRFPLLLSARLPSVLCSTLRMTITGRCLCSARFASFWRFCACSRLNTAKHRFLRKPWTGFAWKTKIKAFRF